MGVQPTISVVVATRDRPLFLHDCLASIARQTVKPDEVVVVNDGGLPDAGAVAERYRDHFPVVYLSQQHRGVGAARNLGARHARGEWICIQDDDDLMCDDRIEVHRRHFQEAGPDVSYGAWVNFSEADNSFELMPGKPFDTNAFFNAGLVLTHGAAAVRRSLALSHPYREDVAAGADFDFLARLIIDGARFDHCGKVLLLRRLHEDRLGVSAPERQASVRAEVAAAWNQGVDPVKLAGRKADAAERPFARIRLTETHFEQVRQAGVSRPLYLEIPINRRWTRNAEILTRLADLSVNAAFHDEGEGADVLLIIDLKGVSKRTLNALHHLVADANTRAIWTSRPPRRQSISFVSALPGEAAVFVRLECASVADGAAAMLGLEQEGWLWFLGRSDDYTATDHVPLRAESLAALARLKSRLVQDHIQASLQVCSRT